MIEKKKHTLHQLYKEEQLTTPESVCISIWLLKSTLFVIVIDPFKVQNSVKAITPHDDGDLTPDEVNDISSWQDISGNKSIQTNNPGYFKFIIYPFENSRKIYFFVRINISIISSTPIKK